MVQAPFSIDQALYPDSDGKPMAENTKQYKWIVRLVENLKRLLADQTAFVAGDLLWYPVQVERGETPPSQAPDILVALGRPEHDRGSYKQWQEDDIAPQVVFEIISPSNTGAEMVAKQAFYARYGVLEMYFYDPESHEFWGLVRENAQDDLKPVMLLDFPWVSPLLQIRFEMFVDGLAVYYPDEEPFKTFTELAAERDLAQTERDATQTKLDEAQAKLDRAIAKMKAAGLDLSDL